MILAWAPIASSTRSNEEGRDASPHAVVAVAGGQENLPVASCGIVCQGDVPGAVATGTPATFNGDIYLTPGCTAAPSFDWDFGDGSAHANQQDPTHAYAEIGEYTWIFTVTQPEASMPCTSSGTVQACSFNCEATPSVTFGVPPLPVDFVASASLAGGCSDPITFLWYFGDGSALSHGQDASHIYTGEGVFTWTMTASSGELTCSRTGQIRIPCSTLACAATVPDITTPGQLVTFSGSVTPPQCPDPIVVDWDFGDGSPHAQSLAPSHAYAGTGTYTWAFRAVSGAALCEKSGVVKVVNPPAITLIKKVAPPFKLVVTGDNLQDGIKVYINGTEWTSMAWKSTGKVQLKGGAALKAAVPKGVATIFRFLNPDGGETTTTWSW